ncbi:NADPH-dependent assimilatory sulfite reductase hemoprotein subunit [Coraliomargarita akajimensis]|uniref:Sulfite reductase [NADPH] hemoprotein beta-component n=1 Tax=Coraliomargarita akajimensis (strain DSM 45221 / IAM 15411 / JCM 23193 / KCTC 12865 / 04OKA010-24) TaxID=583355 RepID=D5ENZ0_CORAD|nr:NADPH-dependent assimilatory sulfite reductase hemoprotein subunit [Coraliomargarita akajimensis]ADE53649.1 sulfite reductase (NADPH) hemoprotein, beta- component [Coraliomargarita akajimensis DSM 45221]
MISDTEAPQQLHKNEGIKTNSDYLRGTILESLADTSTGAIAADDQQLTKFHGLYQQDDRDVRNERRKQKLDKAYSFLCRIGVPGGVSTPDQWLVMDELANYCAFNTIKLTTRQAYQLHGILKSNLKTVIQSSVEAGMSSLAACGDVNRNTMSSPNPFASEVHEAVQEVADAIDTHLKPQTAAYSEIWLDGKKIASMEPRSEDCGGDAVEPLYGKTYLPRKFKIAIAVPPQNDVDVFAHCLGFIAIVENGKLAGFNVTVGGGMGMTHGNEKTFPRLADVMAFAKPEQVVAVAEKIVSIQRDWGDRVERAHARFKYTVEDNGVEKVRAELEKRLGYKLEDARDFKFESNGDRYGWVEGSNGKWNLGLFIEGGRVVDLDGKTMKTGMRKIAESGKCQFRLTPNQNVILSDIDAADKDAIDALVAEHGLDDYTKASGMRRSQIACVSLPTCGLALAESERYLPNLVTDLEVILEEAGLQNDEIVIRSTGCPNGCGRPYLGEIGLVGKVPGKYNLYLGAGFGGERLNKLYRTSVTHEEIIEALRPILLAYAKERNEGERFGDFTIRKDYVKATPAGNQFHADIADEAK